MGRVNAWEIAVLAVVNAVIVIDIATRSAVSGAELAARLGVVALSVLYVAFIAFKSLGQRKATQEGIKQ